jgi:serine phosphatase RsbU (regulator of sigma subunit)/pSer/pThr/pTyr-binding forkhead associated (FHA) protein
MAWLVSLDGEHVGRRFPLDSPCLVGRGPLNHVVLDDPRISRQHAKVSPESGGHIVYDLNSANGTFVNEVSVKRKRLEANDVVRFGPFSFRFEHVIRESSAPPIGANFMEVRTLAGADISASIIDSLQSPDVSVHGAQRAAGLAELEDAHRKLATLYGFMQSIVTTLEQGEILERVCANLFDVFPRADTVAVYLRDLASDTIVVRKAVRRDRGRPTVFTLMPQIYDEVVGKGRAILSAPVTPAPASAPRRAQGGLAMHAPMVYRGSAHGVLLVKVDESEGPVFSQRDLDLLAGIASLAAVILQNAHLHAGQLKAQRLAQDLTLAQQIQKSFLPHQLPSVPGLEFITEYRPAFSVGGDFYDLFWLDERRLGLFIGDVAGKGVSAALLMARISSDLRVAALAESDPAGVLARVNRSVLDRKQPEVFVTGIYLTLDTVSREVVLANAGHLPPLVKRRGSGTLQPIAEGTSTAIGFFDESIYEQVTFRLVSGDTMVLCTDGVLEASNLQGEQYGMDRLEAVLASSDSRARGLAEQLLVDLHRHVGEAPQSDDLTLIVCGAE